MKRGERVKLKDGRIGTISDIELIRKKGTVQKYLQIKVDGSAEDEWVFATALLPIVESFRFTFTWHDKTTVVTVNVDYEKKTVHRVLSGWPPQGAVLKSVQQIMNLPKSAFLIKAIQ